MAPVKFFYMPESPPCRMVEMVANMAGITLEKHYVNLQTREQLNNEYIELNPLHKVPFIVDGELRMGESRAIAAYLVNKYMPESNTLYPRDPVKRAQIDELLFFDLGSLYQSSSRLLFPKVIGPVKELDAEAEKAFRGNLEYLDKRIQKNGGKKFLFGDEPTIADVSLAASLSFPQACDYDISDFKFLTAYLDRLKIAIPNYGQINDGPTENMRNYIKSKQGQ